MHIAFSVPDLEKAEALSVKGLKKIFFYRDRQVRGSDTFLILWFLRTKINGKERFYFYALKALALGQENSQSGCLVLSIQLRPDLFLPFFLKLIGGADRVGKWEGCM